MAKSAKPTKRKVDADGNLLPLRQPNMHKVPSRKWKNWPDICQRVFNETYETVLLNQGLYTHPKTPQVTVNRWMTTAWNAAWTAADSCQRALKDIEAGVGYAKA